MTVYLSLFLGDVDWVFVKGLYPCIVFCEWEIWHIRDFQFVATRNVVELETTTLIIAGGVEGIFPSRSPF